MLKNIRVRGTATAALIYEAFSTGLLNSRLQLQIFSTRYFLVQSEMKASASVSVEESGH